MAVVVLMKSMFQLQVCFAKFVTATTSGQLREPQPELFLKLVALLIGKMC